MKNSTGLFLAALLLVGIVFSFTRPVMGSKQTELKPKPGVKFGTIDQKVVKTNNEWQKILTPAQFHVTREAGTEIPFTGLYAESKTKGTYECVDCGNPLFKSDTKFDSGTGWPSFWAPISPNSVRLVGDSSLGMERTEVVCARCGAHLGHIFDDGPPPTGKRYCMNSVALNFVPAKK